MAADVPVVPVVVGPTAVGKTALAVSLADLLPIEVISADSRQIYRRLDVGTAKPTPDEIDGVPHHGIDCVDVGEQYSAGRFRDDAETWLADVFTRATPVVVGGTGLYVRALAEGIFDEPDLDPVARDRLRRWVGEQGNLQRWATRLDPGYQPGGLHRTTRAIEVALLTGRPLSWWHGVNAAAPVIIPWYIRLTEDRAVLVSRIESRVDTMLGGGMIEEVEALLAEGVLPTAAGLDAVGYRDVVKYVGGEITQAELRYRMVVETRQYAKRQETWFRNQLPPDGVIVLNAGDGPVVNARTILANWHERPDG